MSSPGTVVFDGTKVIMGPSGGDPIGLMTRGVTGPIPFRNLTMRYTLTEVNAPPTAGKQYFTGIFGADSVNIILLALTGDGTLLLEIGDGLGNGLTYTGTWSPVAGATHKIQCDVDAVGTPTLTIDGVNIALTFAGPGAGALTPDTIGTSIQNTDFDGQGAMDDLFFTSPVVPYSAVFCCS